jgi:hypothetical protein
MCPKRMKEIIQVNEKRPTKNNHQGNSYGLFDK